MERRLSSRKATQSVNEWRCDVFMLDAGDVRWRVDEPWVLPFIEVGMSGVMMQVMKGDEDSHKWKVKREICFNMSVCKRNTLKYESSLKGRVFCWIYIRNTNWNKTKSIILYKTQTDVI